MNWSLLGECYFVVVLDALAFATYDLFMLWHL